MNFLLGWKPFHTIIHFEILQICFFHFETATQYITVYLHHDYLSEKIKKNKNKCLLQHKPYSDNLDSKLIVFNINTTLIILSEINSC
jgi:hypothetical protein